MFKDIRKVFATISPLLINGTNKIRTLGSLVLTIANVTFSVGIPIILFKSLAQNSINIGRIAALGGIWTAGKILPEVRTRLLGPLSTTISINLSEKIIAHVYDLPLEENITSPTGGTIQLIFSTFQSIRQFIPALLGSFIPGNIEVVTASIVFGCLYGPVIGIIIPSIAVIHISIMFIFARKAVNSQKNLTNEGYKFYGHILSALGNYENIHYFGNRDYTVAENRAIFGAFEKVANNNLNLVNKHALVQNILLGLSLVGILSYSAVRAADDLAPIDLLIITYYLLNYLSLLGNMAQSVKDLNSSFIDLEKIINFLEKLSPVAEKKEALTLQINPEQACIEFRNVTFKYADKIILQNVSFVAKPLEKTAIVGLSGAGKSTILRLLLRFYDINDGAILINGINIRDITLASLRACFSIVPQTPILFNKDIEENIRYGNIKATDQQLQLAVQNARLKTYIADLPEGMKTMVGELGAKVSGGQKQRIAIARAILKNGPIYFLDEATSSLDATTEREIQSNFDEITANRTTLTVTHRLNTITNADNIIYLDDGIIAEQGTFDQLMKQKGKFHGSMVNYCDSLGIDVESVRPHTKRPPSNGMNTPLNRFFPTASAPQNADFFSDISSTSQIDIPDDIKNNTEEDNDVEHGLLFSEPTPAPT